MAVEPKTLYTYADLASFPDDHLRREIIDGELIVTPSPRTRHQDVVAELVTALRIHSKKHGGRAFPAPLDVFFADDNVVEPDVLFVSEEDRPAGDDIVRSVPLVVVEVSSPSQRRLELVRKRELYERFSVPEYWYVDLEAERVEIYRLDQGRYGHPIMLGRGDELTSPLLPEFSMSLDELLGEEEVD